MYLYRMGMRIVHSKARALIDGRGLRYDRLAAKVNLTPDRFNHILNGRRPVPDPPENFYASLAEALFCQPDDIRELEPEPAAA